MRKDQNNKSLLQREDGINSDTSPVHVSTAVDDRSGQPDETEANKTQKPNKKETAIERSKPLCSDIPEWLREFREHFVDDEVHTPVLLMKYL